MYDLTDKPEIDAGFYFDLAVRSLTAVHDMKSAGSWPEMAYTKCSDYTSTEPIDRTLDLVSSIQVFHSQMFLETSSFYMHPSRPFQCRILMAP